MHGVGGGAVQPAPRDHGAVRGEQALRPCCKPGMRRTAHCCGSVARGRQLLPKTILLALSRGPLVSVACSLAQALHTELTLRGSNVRAHVPASQPATRASSCPPAPTPRALPLWMRCTPHSPVCGGATTPEPRGRAARQVLCPSIVASNLVNSSRYFLSQFTEVRPKPPAGNGRRYQPAVKLEPPTPGVCQDAPRATDARRGSARRRAPSRRRHRARGARAGGARARRDVAQVRRAPQQRRHVRRAGACFAW